MIGVFGKAVFEVSDSFILTFENFTKRKSIRTATLDILDGSQKVQFMGENLSEIELDIQLNIRFVEDVIEEINEFEQMQNGVAYRLIIGGRNYGRFFLEELTQKHKYIDNKGKLLNALLHIKLKEYR